MNNVLWNRAVSYIVIAAMVATGLFFYLPTVAKEAVRAPIVALAETSPPLDTYFVSGERYYSDAYEVLALVNEERAKEDLPALAMDAELLDAAMQRAAEVNLYFAHERPNGESCFTISDKAFGENIAAGSRTAADTMRQWMNSPGHKANILGSQYQSIGIGCFIQGSMKCWVQLFGRGQATGDASGKTDAKATKVTEAIKVSRGDFPFSLQSAKKELASKKTVKITASVANPGWSYLTTEILPKSFKWKSSDTSVATVSKNGVVTGAEPGAVTITAMPSGNPGAKQRVKLGICPPKTSVSKLTSVAKGQMKVAWKKVSGVTKYEVQYRSKGASEWSKKTAPGSASSLTIKKLQRGKTYQVRIRSYKNVSGVKYKSAWSAVKTSKKIR